MSEHHEAASAAMYPAIPHLVGDIASGRAEETSFFTQIFAPCAKICVKKTKQYHAAAGESGHSSRQTPGLEPTA
jgi:hypothetical protein